MLSLTAVYSGLILLVKVLSDQPIYRVCEHDNQCYIFKIWSLNTDPASLDHNHLEFKLYNKYPNGYQYMSTIVIEGGITIETGVYIGVDVDLSVFFITEDNNQLISETGDSFVEE